MTTMHAELETEIFRQALDGMCVGMVLVDAAGRLVWANRAAQSTLGIDAESARGRVLGPLLTDPQISAFWQEAARSEGTLLSEAAVRSPHPAHLKLNAARCVDSAGRTIGRALLFCDVTADRALQIRLSEEATSRLLQMTETAKSSAQPRAGLTAKELEVLRRVGRGATNEGIAREFEIAASTVRSHIKRLYRKLGLKSRSDAVRYAVENGLV